MATQLDLERTMAFSAKLREATEAAAQAFHILRPDLSNMAVQVSWAMVDEKLVLTTKSREGKAPEMQPIFAA